MLPHHVDIRSDGDGLPVVMVTFDLGPAQVGSALQGLRTIREARYRTAEIAADDVIALRELTSLVDELDGLVGADAIVRLEATVALLGVLRDALHEFATAEHPEREGDAQARPAVYALLDALDELNAQAVRTALDGLPALR